MSDPTTSLPLPERAFDGVTSGQMIREAREAMGLHIVALAAALKVPVRKLEALEANRWEELTDTTFTRALASSVARHLKIDAAPVLAGLPTAALSSLNTPAGLGRVRDGAASVSLVLLPVASLGRHTWLVGALLLAAAALYFSPQIKAFLPVTHEVSAETMPVLATDVLVSVEPAASGAAASTSPKLIEPGLPEMPTGLPIQSQLPSKLPVPAAGDSAQQSAQPLVSERVLVLLATVDTWVEVTDRDKRVRIQRVLKQGEEAVFAEGYPFGVVVGNAAGARVTVRGQPLDLAVLAKNNVARFEVR